MPLTDSKMRLAVPTNKPFKLFDSQGLYLLVMPSGGRWWRFRYRLDGKHKTLSMGIYPEVSLKAARVGRDQARGLLREGVDPSAVRREQKAKDNAERQAAKDSSRLRVAIDADGTIELWKGKAVLRLSAVEAETVKTLLQKVAA